MTDPSFRPCALVPCLDAASTIGAVIEGLRAALPGVDTIVVDDGSTDGSTGAALEAGAAAVVRHERNRGKGAALLTGLATAQSHGFTHAVSLDADGQHDPADAPRLLDAARASPTSLVVGARDFSVPNVPGGSRFGRRFSNFWVRLETGRHIDDTQSGFRTYPVKLARLLGVRPSRFQWEVEVIVRAVWAGLDVVEVPISVFYPPPGERVSHYRGFVDSTLISLMHFRLVGRWMLRPLWPVRRVLPPP